MICVRRVRPKRGRQLPNVISVQRAPTPLRQAVQNAVTAQKEPSMTRKVLNYSSCVQIVAVSNRKYKILAFLEMILKLIFFVIIGMYLSKVQACKSLSQSSRNLSYLVRY